MQPAKRPTGVVCDRPSGLERVVLDQLPVVVGRAHLGFPGGERPPPASDDRTQLLNPVRYGSAA